VEAKSGNQSSAREISVIALFAEEAFYRNNTPLGTRAFLAVARVPGLFS
jgi:hypothetical protein